MADHNGAGGTSVGKVSRNRLDEIHWKSMDGREDKIKINFKGVGLKWLRIILSLLLAVGIMSFEVS